MSLYINNELAKDDVLALCTLHRLRLDMFGWDHSCPSPPSGFLLETIIIDVLPRVMSFARYCGDGHLERRNRKIERCRTFVNSNSNSLDGGVVVAKSCVRQMGSVLGAWRDIVQGGSDC